MGKMEVMNIDIRTAQIQEQDYISLTVIAKYKSERTDDLIRNWIRNRNTIEFLGIWEQLNNPVFNPVEFDGFKKERRSVKGKVQRVKLEDYSYNSVHVFKVGLGYEF